MAVQAEKLSWILRQSGIRVVTVRTNAPRSGTYRLISAIPGFRTFLNLLFFLKNLRSALKQSDVIYLMTAFFNFFFWVTYPALILIKVYGKPVILSARGGDAHRFFGKHGKLIRPILDKADAITTPSRFLCKAFWDAFAIKAHVVPNVADLEQFRFVSRERFQAKLLVTRNLEKIYDIGCVIRAFKRVFERFPDAELGIVGEGTLEKQLKSLAAELGVHKQTHFYGPIQHAEIHKLYEKYDIYVNASRVDNLPGSILEAFACGLPVVSTNAGGVPFMVEHGRTGFLVELGDYEQLAAKVIEIVENPAIGRRLAEAAFREAKQYSWEHVGPILLNLFRDVLKNQSADLNRTVYS